MTSCKWIFILVICTLVSNSFAKPPYAGGETSVEVSHLSDHGIFSFPATNLSLTRRDNFFVGNSFFRNAWVTAPASTGARDGLGPLFNTNACQSCHIRDGRGRPPRHNEGMISMLIKLSINDHHEVLDKTQITSADPNYGLQIQNKAIAGILPEAQVQIEWVEIPGEYEDGTKYSLRKPKYHLTDLAYGNMHEQVLLSGRVAPQMIGLGLLEEIPLNALEKHADPNDVDGNGISGRFNQVWNVDEGKVTVGRFGWKASQPTVKQQAAAAFSADIGITSSLFPDDSCTQMQDKCIQAPSGGSPEVTDEILNMVTFYSKTLAVPMQRGEELNKRGERLFHEIGCASCHVDTWQTGNNPEFPELSGQEIHPYTDLLLHDMGDGLADGRIEFLASGSEWRTPPLWGIGLIPLVNKHSTLLHDGRARNIEEAILWHGGEAKDAKEKFRELNASDRNNIIEFIKSL